MWCRLSLLLITSFFSSTSSSFSPIIFIPGSFCSLLEVRINTTLQPSCSKTFDNQWMTLWLNVRLFEPQHLPCFHQIFRFYYNTKSQTFELPLGVETRLVPKTMNDSFLRGVLWEYVGLDQFFLHFTTKFQYIDGHNLRSIAYDFRRGDEMTLFDFSMRLKDLIESSYRENSNKSVHLVSHSTGGSMTLFFLAQQDQQWKDRYIRNWISLSGNLAGEVDNLANILQGFASPLVPRDIIQSWDFFAWRLPEPVAYGSNRLILETPTQNYTSNHMFNLLQEFNVTALATVYPKLSMILASLPAPNVSTYCFFGVNVSTPIAYRLKTSKLETIFGWGDGEQDDTTNMSCQLWNQTMDKKYSLTIKGFDRIRHTELVSNKQVLQKIDQIISNDMQ